MEDHAEMLRAARERLAVLDRERSALVADIQRMEDNGSGAGISTAEGRVRLFASLFRGRTDVFATRWESRTGAGRSGWAPRCANEWKPGLCHKPRVKCAGCDHRRFVAFTEREVRRHLEGHQTAGIYPLLGDETCHLVAIDLDGPSWRQDVEAVRTAASGLEVPVLVERSRSGDGAHVWVLFDEPLAASTARAVGSRLLTEAMSRRAIAMESYDRLFPNQDTMPAGGFGNLIALPLQRERRKDGCTVFLDDELLPFPDQWALLASVGRLPAEHARDLSRVGGWSAGLPTWDASSAHRPAALKVVSGRIRARLSGRLEIQTSGLPAEVLHRLRRVAAFANPMFFERERARLSTHRTPRVIACHEERSGVLLLPRGCADRAVAVASELGFDVELTDERRDGEATDLTFVGTLRPEQKRTVSVVGRHDLGVLVAPPGAGKTVMAASLIAGRRRATLVIVHRRLLLDQWRSRLSEFLDLQPSAIGSPDKPGSSGVDVAMIQTLARRDDVASLARYGQIVIDECHHVPAVTTEAVLRELPARFVLGVTATPARRDGHQPIIEMQCGPIRHTMTVTAELETAVRRVLVERRSAFDATVLPPEPTIQEVLGAVAGDGRRTQAIVTDILAAVDEGRFPLVLPERRGHLEALSALLAARTEVVCLHGGIGVKAQRRCDEVLASGRPRVVVATGRYIGEGFDDARLDTLILAMPIAWKGTMTQYAGRLHRHHEHKRECRIVDYVDHDVPVLRRMYAKRQRAYARLGYSAG